MGGSSPWECACKEPIGDGLFEAPWQWTVLTSDPIQLVSLYHSPARNARSARWPKIVQSFLFSLSISDLV